MAHPPTNKPRWAHAGPRARRCRCGDRRGGPPGRPLGDCGPAGAHRRGADDRLPEPAARFGGRTRPGSAAAALLTALGQAVALLWRPDAPIRSAVAVMILYAVSVLTVGAVPPRRRGSRSGRSQPGCPAGGPRPVRPASPPPPPSAFFSSTSSFGREPAASVLLSGITVFVCLSRSSRVATAVGWTPCDRLRPRNGCVSPGICTTSWATV